MSFSIKLIGFDKLHANVKSLAKGVRPEEILPVIGRRVTYTEIPLRFSQNGPGWKVPLRGGSPMNDAGLLKKSFVWNVAGRKLTIGTPHPGGFLNKNLTILPKTAKWLVIPFAPNLSTTERRTFKLRSYKGVFFVMSRKSGSLLAFVREGKGLPKLIAVLKKEVKIEARRMLGWDLYGASAESAAVRYLGALFSKGKGE